MITVAEKLARFRTIEDALRDCPNRADHTPCPTGYLAQSEWAQKKLKTHRQIRCEGCGRFLIWAPRKAAKSQEPS